MNKIIITIEGGIIQDITGIPFGVEVEVVDYDIETDDDEISIETWSSQDTQ